MRRAPLAVACLLTAITAHADVIQVDAPESAVALQAQTIQWAPGLVPRLVIERTDRRSSSRLQVVELGADGPTQQLVPVARSARLDALGVGGDVADSGATWWDESSFLFMRAQGGRQGLALWDGQVRSIDLGEGALPLESMRTGRGLVLVVEDADGTDIALVADPETPQKRERLTKSRAEVEHSLRRTGGMIGYIGTSRETTRWCRAPLGGAAAPNCLVFPGVELLSLSVGGLADDKVLAYARMGARSEGDQGHHALLELSRQTQKFRVVADDVYLPPGLAPRPALDASRNTVYFVQDAAGAANPIVALNLTDSSRRTLPLETRAHQEVAAARYPAGADGRLWLAVVAVGDESDKDVHNHLYVMRPDDR